MNVPVEYQLYCGMRQHHPSLLFFISRESDDRIALYNAKRKDNELIDNCVDVSSSFLSDCKSQTRLPSKLEEMFFAMKVEKQDGKYMAQLVGLKSRPLQLRLKKIDNRVTCTSTIVIPWNHSETDIEILNAEIYNVHLFFVDRLGLPDVDRIEVHARASQLDIVQACKKASLPVPTFTVPPNEMIHVVEKIKVTPDMKQNISVSDLWQMFTAKA